MASSEAAEAQEASAEAAKEMTAIEVSTLSGQQAVVQCEVGSLLKDVTQSVVDALGISAPVGVRYLAGTEPLSDEQRVESIPKGTQVTVIAKAPSDWYAGHKFTFRHIRGRRGGLEEESAEADIVFHEDGTFLYTEAHHNHDYDGGETYWYDSKSDASGSWTSAQSGESVTLTGTRHSKWSSSSSRGGEDTKEFTEVLTKQDLSGQSGKAWRRKPIEQPPQ